MNFVLMNILGIAMWSKYFSALAEYMLGAVTNRLMVAYCSCLQPDLNLLQICIKISLHLSVSLGFNLGLEAYCKAI